MNNPHDLSENSKHWNQVCLSLLTIATATLGVVFLVSGLAGPEKDSVTHLDLVKTAATGTATVAYSLMTFTAISAIIGPRDISQQQVDQWKHTEATKVLSWLMVIVIFLALNIFATIYDPKRIFPDTPDPAPAKTTPIPICPETLQAIHPWHHDPIPQLFATPPRPPTPARTALRMTAYSNPRNTATGITHTPIAKRTNTNPRVATPIPD